MIGKQLLACQGRIKDRGACGSSRLLLRWVGCCYPWAILQNRCLRRISAGPLPEMSMRTTAEWQDVDIEKFRAEVYPSDRPAVFRGLVKDWPALREGGKSPQALCDYIRSFDLGRPIQTAVGPPEIKGRLFYN